MAGLHVPLSTLRHSPRGPSTHDLGPSWIATPSMSGVLIPFLMPVYPGAFPTFRVKAADQARVASMPGIVWPIGGHPPDSSWSNPTAPVSMPSRFVSTPQQRFAYARLPGPYLTPLPAPFPHRSPRTAFSRRSMRRFGASPPQGDSEGPQPSSSTQHRIHQDLLPIDLAFCVRGALGRGNSDSRREQGSCCSAIVAARRTKRTVVPLAFAGRADPQHLRSQNRAASVTGSAIWGSCGRSGQPPFGSSRCAPVPSAPVARSAAAGERLVTVLGSYRTVPGLGTCELRHGVGRATRRRRRGATRMIGAGVGPRPSLPGARYTPGHGRHSLPNERCRFLPFCRQIAMPVTRHPSQRGCQHPVTAPPNDGALFRTGFRRSGTFPTRPPSGSPWETWPAAPDTPSPT